MNFFDQFKVDFKAKFSIPEIWLKNILQFYNLFFICKNFCK